MKKGYIFALILFLLFPTLVFASRYDLKDTDLSILLNDEVWYSFTRDNIKENELLEELGITYDYLKEFMDKNSIYLDAVSFSEDTEDTIELFVRKKEGINVDNLNKHSKKEMNLLKEELAQKQNSPFSEIYENDYKFIHLEYPDGTYQVLEYYTVINHDAYTITVQKNSEFTSSEKEEIKKIIDSIIFDIDASSTEDFKNFEYIIIGAIAGAIGGLLVYFQNRKKIKI